MSAVLASECMAPRVQAVPCGLQPRSDFPNHSWEKAESMSPRVKKIPGHCHSRGLCQAGLSSDHSEHSGAVPEDGNHLLSLYLKEKYNTPRLQPWSLDFRGDGVIPTIREVQPSVLGIKAGYGVRETA